MALLDVRQHMLMPFFFLHHTTECKGLIHVMCKPKVYVTHDLKEYYQEH